jgi:hypothetical protein
LPSGLREGLSAQVWSAALGEKKIAGMLTQITPADGNGAAVEIQIKSEDVAGRGAVVAQGWIVLDQTMQALLVPRAAVGNSSSGTKFLFKLSAGRALRQPVTLGATEGDWVIVQQGLSETDVVIIDNLNSIKPGVRVRALTPNY